MKCQDLLLVVEILGILHRDVVEGPGIRASDVLTANGPSPLSDHHD